MKRASDYMDMRAYQIFEEVMGHPYDHLRRSDDGFPEDSIAMQKIVYLLEYVGFDFGSYSYCWGKYGPYAIDLENDIKTDISNGFTVPLECAVMSQYARERIEKLIRIVSDQQGYPRYRWLEAIATMHYFRNGYLGSSSKARVLGALKAAKSYLDIDDLNQKAFDYSKAFDY